MDLEGLIRNFGRDDEALGPAIELLEDIRRLDEHRPANLSKLVPKVSKLKALASHSSFPIRKHRPLTEWLSFYDAELLEAGAWLRDTFGLEVERGLEEIGLRLSGHYPELRAGLFTVVLDFTTYRTTMWYGPKQERFGQCPMWPPTVAEKLVQLRDILGGPATVERFRENLEQAYKSLTDGKQSVPIPIINVLEALVSLQAGHLSQAGPARRKFKGSARADFSYNLFRFASPLIQAGLQLKVASLSHTRSRGQFLWVPDSESGSGTVYSHVVWRGIG